MIFASQCLDLKGNFVMRGREVVSLELEICLLRHHLCLKL
jgi:hypothetical protein